MVDDEWSLRQLLIRALTQVGMRCDSADDGEMALKLCERTCYDLVVTDLKMPHGNGHAFCVNLLGSKNRPALLAVLTGVAEPRIEQDLRRRGVEHIFYKPVDYKQFAANLRSLVEQARESNDVELPEWDANSNSSAARHTLVVLSSDISYCNELMLAAGTSAIEIVIAVSTDHLLEIVNERRIDLLVIDQALPGFLKGDQIVARLHAELINIPAFLRGDPETLARVNVAQCEGVERTILAEMSVGEVLKAAYGYLTRLSEYRLMIDSFARRLVTEFSDVPPFPHVLTRLASHAAKSSLEISIPQLVSEIETDSRLTSELIKVANSSQVSATSRQKDLKSIITLLGPRQAISLCLSLGLRTVRAELMKPWAEDFRHWYLKRTALIAATAEAVARHCDSVPPETAFLVRF